MELLLIIVVVLLLFGGGGYWGRGRGYWWGNVLLAASPAGVIDSLAINGKRMDKDRIKGAARQVQRRKVTGDTKLQTEGEADKAAGKAQKGIGGWKDTPRRRWNNVASVASLWQSLNSIQTADAFGGSTSGVHECPWRPLRGPSPSSIGLGACAWYGFNSNNDNDKWDMNKDRIKGASQRRKVRGDVKLEAEGKVDKAAGKAQSTIGDLKGTLRGK
jgi:uncharacterized protein YjbJ (UPF0337 family)